MGIHQHWDKIRLNKQRVVHEDVDFWLKVCKNVAKQVTCSSLLPKTLSDPCIEPKIPNTANVLFLMN